MDINFHPLDYLIVSSRSRQPAAEVSASRSGPAGWKRTEKDLRNGAEVITFAESDLISDFIGGGGQLAWSAVATNLPVESEQYYEAKVESKFLKLKNYIYLCNSLSLKR